MIGLCRRWDFEAAAATTVEAFPGRGVRKNSGLNAERKILAAPPYQQIAANRKFQKNKEKPRSFRFGACLRIQRLEN
jgi:hypothetical protein